VKNILNNTSRSVDQVTVQPDGKWDVNAKKDIKSNHRPSGFSDESDDDLVEVTKSGNSIRMSTPRNISTPLGSLPGRPRDMSSSSSVPQMNGSVSGKRTIGAVIDLTSSGDEDEEPIAPTPKRANLNGFGSYPGGPAW
jgi:E3 SUMO-protein ligase PIAS1